MDKRYTQTTKPVNECGFKSDLVRSTKKCAYCNQPYKRYVDEIDYILKLDGKIKYYCSYNCRSKARKLWEEQQFNKVDAKVDITEHIELKTLLIEMNNRNLTYLEMGLELGCSQKTVANLFKQYGIAKNKQSHGGKNRKSFK